MFKNFDFESIQNQTDQKPIHKSKFINYDKKLIEQLLIKKYRF